MTAGLVDRTTQAQISELAQKVLDGGALSAEQARWLFELDAVAAVHELLYWANKIRCQYKGNRIRLCSIVNIKAGRCPEDCKFCAQSAHYNTPSPRYELIDEAAIVKAAEYVRAYNVRVLGVVAAWPYLKEGPILDRLCERLSFVRRACEVELHASLGIIKSQRVADRLKAAGIECYNHNLETSSHFFPQICTTHSYSDRLQTLKHLKHAGIKVCSGGIIGLGETSADRCDLALALREIGADVVPINILNPIPGTPLSSAKPPPPLETLKTIACFRFVLPSAEITIAGGRAVNLRDLQSLIFMAGASALMVGNYLTTPNRPIQDDIKMLEDLGLERW